MLPDFLEKWANSWPSPWAQNLTLTTVSGSSSSADGMVTLMCLLTTCSTYMRPSHYSALYSCKLSKRPPGVPSKTKSDWSWKAQTGPSLALRTRSVSSSPLLGPCLFPEVAEVALDLFSYSSLNNLVQTFATLHSVFIQGCSAISLSVGLLLPSCANILRIKSLNSFDSSPPPVFFQYVSQSPLSNKL